MKPARDREEGMLAEKDQPPARRRILVRSFAVASLSAQLRSHIHTRGFDPKGTTRTWFGGGGSNSLSSIGVRRGSNRIEPWRSL